MHSLRVPLPQTLTGSWKLLPGADGTRPSPGPRHSGFTHEFPQRNASRWPCTVSGCQPPQGQFQERNCFGLGFGSENKHSGFYRFPVLAAAFLSSSCSIGPFIQKPVASEEALGSALKAPGMFIWGGGSEARVESVTSPQASARLTQLLKSSDLSTGSPDWSQGRPPTPDGLSQPGTLGTRNLPLAPSWPTVLTPHNLPGRKRKQGCELVHSFFSG